MYGYTEDADLVLSDAQALPSATAADSTNMIKTGGNTNGRMEIVVVATTALAVATGKAFNIELQTFTADTAASAASPYDDGHVYLIHKTSADAGIAVSAGDVICRYIVTEDEDAYVQLVFTTDEDLSAQTVTAFARVLT